MNKVCVIIGVGPGNGEALARRFSEGGFHQKYTYRRLWGDDQEYGDKTAYDSKTHCA